MARARRPLTFPWAEAIPGLLFGLVVGALAAVHFGRSVAGVTKAPIPIPESWAYGYTAASLGVLAAVGVVVAAAGFVWRAERQYVNFAIIGGGLGIMLLGASFLAFERVEVTPERITYRSWWGVARDEVAFADLRDLRYVHHRSWRRSRVSLEYVTHDGREGRLCSRVGRQGVFFWSQAHVIRAAHRAGVGVRQE